MKPVRGLKLRNGIWYLKVQVNGRRVRRSLGLPKEALREANEVAKAFWHEVALGRLGLLKPSPPLRLLFDNYLDSLRKDNTREYTERIAGYFRRVLDNFDWVEFKDFIPVAFHDWLVAMKTTNTARRIQRLVNAAFAYAERRGEIDENLTANLPTIKHTDSPHEPLSWNELVAFMEECRDYTCGNLLLFICRTGVRVGEAVNATWQRIDLDARVFALRAADRKNRKPLEVGLADDVCMLLASIKPHFPAPDSLVFPNTNGLPFSNTNVRKIVQKIGKKVGRPDFTTHGLRHTFNKLCRDREDVSLSDMTGALGQSSERANRRYDHPNPERQRLVADKLPRIPSIA